MRKITTSKENKREQSNGEEDDDELLARTVAIPVGRHGDKGEAFTSPVSLLFLCVI